MGQLHTYHASMTAPVTDNICQSWVSPHSYTYFRYSSKTLLYSTNACPNLLTFPSWIPWTYACTLSLANQDPMGSSETVFMLQYIQVMCVVSWTTLQASNDWQHNSNTLIPNSTTTVQLNSPIYKRAMHKGTKRPHRKQTLEHKEV